MARSSNGSILVSLNLLCFDAKNAMFMPGGGNDGLLQCIPACLLARFVDVWEIKL